MKTIYKLFLPKVAQSPFNEFIEVPFNADGMKLAEWWSSASFDNRDTGQGFSFIIRHGAAY